MKRLMLIAILMLTAPIYAQIGCWWCDSTDPAGSYCRNDESCTWRLFDGQPLEEGEVSMRARCECGDSYGQHRVRGDCARCGCEQFVAATEAVAPNDLRERRADSLRSRR